MHICKFKAPEILQWSGRCSECGLIRLSCSQSASQLQGKTSVNKETRNAYVHRFKYPEVIYWSGICSVCVVVMLFCSRSVSQLNKETQTAHRGLKQSKASNIADDSTVCYVSYILFCRLT